MIDLLRQTALYNESFCIPMSKDLREGTFNSLRVKLYRARQELETLIPEIKGKVDISQTTINGNKMLTIGPAKPLIIYRKIGDQLIELESEQSSQEAKKMSEAAKLPEAKRIISLMIKDEIPEEEVLEVIKGFGPEKETELMEFYSKQSLQKE